MTPSQWPRWFPECLGGSARRRSEADSEDGELEAFGVQSSPAQGGHRLELHSTSRTAPEQYSCAEANAHSGSRNDQGNRSAGPSIGRLCFNDCLPSEPTAAGSVRQLLMHSNTTPCCGTQAKQDASNELDDAFNTRILGALKPVNAPNPHCFIRCLSSDLFDLPCDEPAAPAHRARHTYSSYFQYEAGQWTAQELVDDESPASESSDSGTSGEEEEEDHLDPLSTRDPLSKGSLTDLHPVPEDQRSWGSAQSV